MNLFIGNLHPDTNAEGLKKLFSEFGEIVLAKVIFDNATGTSRGFGFVEMADKGQSYDAIDNLDCSYFEGNIISVKEAKQSNTNTPSRGGGGSFRPNKPRPRPGGYNNNNGGGYNSNNNSGGYNNNNRSYNSNNNGGGYNNNTDPNTNNNRY